MKPYASLISRCCVVFGLFVGCIFSANAESLNPNSVNRTDTARQGANFQITHYTIDAGYQLVSGGAFSMRGIIGQADAGISQGNDMVFVGGFLEAGAPLLSEFLFQDSFESIP